MDIYNVCHTCNDKNDINDNSYHYVKLDLYLNDFVTVTITRPFLLKGSHLQKVACTVWKDFVNCLQENES